MTIDVYNIEGKTTGKITLPKEYFGAKINEALLAQAVYVYLVNQRSAQAKTKTRSEVALTTAKWFRQKGTGRARHGAKSAPIFVGGGVAHGPRGHQNWARRLSAKMKKEALCSSLTTKFKNKEVMVVEGWEKLAGKTKAAAGFLTALLGKQKKRKCLLVLDKKNEAVNRVFRNLPGVRLILARDLNAYEILNGGQILITPKALESLPKL